MRVLITGASGQLGSELVDCFKARGGVRTDVVGASHSQLDVSDRDMVMQAVVGLRPSLIVHAGAWTAVDDCESDPDRAYAVNAWGTRNVAEAARRVGAHLCYVSTDYVFDGRSERPYVEWDRPNPLSVYGASKLAGEQECDPAWTVVRTSWVMSARGSNMLRTVLRLAAEGGQLRFVDDQRGCPTFTCDLAPRIRELALARQPGIYHVTNQGSTTWFEFARQVLATAGMDPARVVPISTGELDPPRPALRPANSVLDNLATRLAGLPPLPPWQHTLKSVLDELVGHHP